MSGTNVGDTRITITPAKTSSNIYKHKIAASVSLPTYDALCTTGYTAWDGTANITAATGQKILIVECASDGKARKAGIATVTAKV